MYLIANSLYSVRFLYGEMYIRVFQRIGSDMFEMKSCKGRGLKL